MCCFLKDVFENLKKHKGFTLVELLAVIVIISILSFVIIPSISKYMERGKKDYNVKLEDSFLLAGKNYFADNSSKIPKYENGASRVTLGELESLGLVSGDFYDSDSAKCDLNMSYVKVANNGNNKYVYTPCLKCGDSFSEKEECNMLLTNNDSYSCKVTLPSGSDSKWYNSDSLNNVKATVNVKKNATSYVGDFKYFYGGLEVLLDTSNSFTLDRISLDAKENGHVLVDIDGENNRIDCTFDKIKLDDDPPKCTLNSFEANPICTDSGGSYCKEIDSNFCTTHGSIKTCIVYDNAGNSGTCSATKPDVPEEPTDPVKDVTSPTCTVSSDSSKWYNSNVKVTAKCTDDSGSCTVSSKTHTFTSSGSYEFKFSDAAGNEGSCTAKVKIDKTPPKCAVSKSPSSTWINSSSSDKSVMLYGTCSDTGGSGCKSSKVSSGPWTKQGMRNLSPGYVYDNAGNKTKCGTAKVYIDTTPPKCAGAVRNGTKDGNVQYKYTYTDNVSGVKSEKHGHCYTSSNAERPYKCSTESPYSRLTDASYRSFDSPSTKETRNYNYKYGTGTVLIYFKIKDVAGNEAYCKFHTDPYAYSYKHSW